MEAIRLVSFEDDPSHSFADMIEHIRCRISTRRGIVLALLSGRVTCCELACQCFLSFSFWVHCFTSPFGEYHHVLRQDVSEGMTSVSVVSAF